MHKAVFLLCVSTIALPAQTLTVVVNFNGTNGASPSGGLIQATDGNYYGVTGGGGSGSGTIFKLSPAGKLTTIYTFSKTDGTFPGAGLIEGTDGNFYGTTTEGGSGGGAYGYGTVFKVTPAGVVSTLYSFTTADGYSPSSPLIQASDGNFYGTTPQGGSGGSGSVFQITPSGTLTILYSFTFRGDGALPWGGLVQGDDGNLYGVTQRGGTEGGSGTIFRITPAGVLTTLYTFTGTDGAQPAGGLIKTSDGNFYGTTFYGGSANNGTVFKITPAGVLTTLHNFSGAEGYGPHGALLLAGDGNFYGVAAGYGTIFKVTPGGALTTLHAFSGSGGSGFDPPGQLIQGSDGNIYGVTAQGGAYNMGTIFTLAIGGLVRPPAATTGTASSVTDTSAILSASVSAGGADTQAWFQYSTDSSMTGSVSTPRQNIGSAPGAVSVVTRVSGLNASTTYYFQAWASNSSGASSGSIATLTTAGAGSYSISGTVLLSGAGLSGVGVALTGTQLASTTTDSFGNYSFSADSGGNYTVTPAANGYTFIPPSLSFTNLNSDQIASFIAVIATPIASPTTIASFNGTNGASPRAGLIQASNGNFYGTTANGGANKLGTIFQVTPSGTITTLHSFTGTDGASPGGAVLQATNGNLYGTTITGGASDYGTVYQVTPTGVFTTLQSFGQSNGAYPVSALIQATDGNLYGTTSGLGPFFPATTFRITAAGALTTLYTFASILGVGPASGLLQGADGNFYGTLKGGLVSSQPGMVFKMTSSGQLTSLYTFCAMSNCNDGEAPAAALVQGADGSLYGTTGQGGANHVGVVFKITPDGAMTTLHTFALADGAGPGDLLLASDVNFYGTTSGGGANGHGTIFQLTPAGTLTALHSFNMTDGDNPQGALIQAADGNLYGTTQGGGDNGNGTVYRLTLPKYEPTIFPSSGLVNGASFQAGIAANSWITILGRNLSSRTDTWDSAIINEALPQSLDGVSVSIDGRPAYIAYVSPGQINALAPDVSAGNVSVTVTNGLGSSAPITAVGQTFQPAFFEWGSYAVATRIDYSVAVKSGSFPDRTTVPAKPGETIILWGTGFGPTTPAAPAGHGRAIRCRLQCGKSCDGHGRRNSCHRFGRSFNSRGCRAVSDCDSGSSRSC